MKIHIGKRHAEATHPSQKQQKSVRRNKVEEKTKDDDPMSEGDDEEPIETFSWEHLTNLLLDAADKHQDVAYQVRMDPLHRKISVFGLGKHTAVETLMNAFKPYGEIEDCIAVTDEVSGECKGYGFILFKSRSGFRRALKEPHKIIGNRMASCVPQKLLNFMKPSLRENEIRAYARMLAIPVNYRCEFAKRILIHSDYPEPMELLLGATQSKIYKEEIKHMYIQKVSRDLRRDKDAAVKCSPTALAYYNQKNNTDLVLVETGIPCLLYAGGYRRFVYHVNFKAKKKNENNNDAVMFFAELLAHGPANPPTVVGCTILNTDVQTDCQGCDPRLKIKHPVDEFDINCRTDIVEEKLSAVEYLAYISDDAEIEGEAEEDDKSDDNDNQISSGDGDGNSDDGETIETLINSFSKDQLSYLLRNAADKHQDVADQIRRVANEVLVHRKIFVYGLGLDTDTETLMNAFKPYGEVKDCVAVTDKVLGKCKGYGFIVFKSQSGACKALKEPRKRIGNLMAVCQLDPQELVELRKPSLRSTEEEARAYARMRARPIKKCSGIESRPILVDYPAPKKVELEFKEFKIYEEELKQMYFEKRLFDLQNSKSDALEYSQIALTYYNKKNYKDFVLVESVILSNVITDTYLIQSFVSHLNFKAKKRNEDDRNAVMFFAEMTMRPGPANPPTVVVCMTLNNADIQTYCQGCHPIFMIKHPATRYGGESFRAQTYSAKYYLGLLWPPASQY